jgi:hypothetical protein
LGLLIGRLGVSKADSLSLTKREFEAVLKHGFEKEKEDWKRSRWMAAVMVNISGKSVKHAIKPSELLRFPDEKKQNNGFSEFLKAHGARYKE